MTNKRMTVRSIKWKVWFIIVSLIILAVAFLLSIHSGAVYIPFNQIWLLLFGQGSDQSLTDIMWNIRLPRTLVAILVGANLAVSGALLQGVMKNPLADPQIIGISSGAGIAGMIVILLFPELPGLRIPVAFIGALLAAMIVYLLAWKDGIRPERIILSGVALTAFIGAGIAALMTFYSDLVQGTVGFMVGGLTAKSWPQFTILYPYSLIGLTLSFIGAKKMNTLMLGDTTAKGLGLRVELTRLAMIVVATLLAASAVSVVGLLGFVGLIVPHIVRMLVGNDYRFLLPASILIGASVLVFSDTLARVIFPPYEIPVGVMMGAIGAPFFLYLLRRKI